MNVEQELEGNTGEAMFIQVEATWRYNTLHHVLGGVSISLGMVYKFECDELRCPLGVDLGRLILS